MAEPKVWVVAPDVALADFNRMCVAHRVDLDESEWTPSDKMTFENTRKLICTAIQAGRVSVDTNGDPVFTFPAAPTGPLKIGKVKGSALMAMDGKLGNSRIFAGLADCCGMGVSHFSGFDVADCHLLTAFYVLFFQP